MKEPTHSKAAPTAIVPSPFNKDRADTKDEPFKELMESIRTHGIIQPPVVRKLPANQANGKQFELIAGERRWRAAQLLQLDSMPIIIREATDAEAIELQTIENDKRKDLSPIQKAEKYHQLLDQYGKAGISGEKGMARLVEKIGKAKSTIYEALSLVKLPPKVKAAVDKKLLPPSHAGLIAKLEKFPQVQEQLLTQALEVDEWDDHDQTEAGTEVMAYRDLKSLVDQEVEVGKNRLKWATRIEEAHKQKLEILYTEEQNEKALSSDKYVRAGQCNYDYKSPNSYKELMGKFAPAAIIAHDEQYNIIELYPKAAVLDAIKQNGKKPSSPGLNRSAQSRGIGAATKAKAAAAKGRRESAERRAIMDAVVEAARKPGSWTAAKLLTFSKFLVRAMNQRVLSDTSREMFNRRKLDSKEWRKKGSYHAPHHEWRKQEIANVKTNEDARALMVDMATAMDLTVWAGEYNSKQPKLLDVACEVFGVDPKKAIKAAELKAQASGPRKTSSRGKGKAKKK